MIGTKNGGRSGKYGNLVVRFQDLDIKSQEVQPRAGLYEVRTELLHPLKPGDSFTVTEMRVPAARPCRNVTATSSVMGGSERTEIAPESLENGTIIRWIKSNPEKGREYIVTCNW